MCFCDVVIDTINLVRKFVKQDAEAIVVVIIEIWSVLKYCAEKPQLRFQKRQLSVCLVQN